MSEASLLYRMQADAALIRARHARSARAAGTTGPVAPVPAFPPVPKPVPVRPMTLSQAATLAALRRSTGGSRRASELGRLVGLSNSAFYEQRCTLEARGWVTSVLTGAGKGNWRLVTLTDAGRAALDAWSSAGAQL